MADIDTLSGSIIFNQISLNYNERLKHTKYYEKDLKHKLNLLLPVQIRKETEHFDKVFDEDSNMVSAVCDNVQKGIALLLTHPFSEMTVLTQIVQCFSLDKEKLESCMVEILTENYKEE